MGRGAGNAETELFTVNDETSKVKCSCIIFRRYNNLKKLN